MRIADIVRKNTLVDTPRLKVIMELLTKTNSLVGYVAEVGVYKGGTARVICDNTSKTVFLFDTFEGLPEPKAGVDTHHKGDFKDTSLEHLYKVLGPNDNYVVYKGIFPRQNSEPVQSKTFAFVHLDVDIYPSIKECLEFFYPRMTSGGVIILDDYLASTCRGAKLAADEFFADKPQKIKPTVQSQAIIEF